MLYYLHTFLNINILQYLTVRAGIAFFLAFTLTLLIFPRFIKLAKRRHVNQPISTFISHECKKNTPTMGGVIFIGCTIIASLFCANISNPYVIIGILLMILFGLIGVSDDLVKIITKKNAGISSRQKMLLLMLASGLISICIANTEHHSLFYIPFVKHAIFDLSEYLNFNLLGIKIPCLSIMFWIVVFISCTNAVNITDGLDGLACVPSIFALATLSAFVYVAGHYGFSSYLHWPRVAHAGEIIVISCAFIGALLGFLWYNAHPAEIFMGDSGSLGIGAFISYMSIISNNEILLILIGLIFVIETLSVIIQIGSYKTKGKKVFLMAPIHHHFEKKGWAENKIIVRFWIIALLANIIALLSIKIR